MMPLVSRQCGPLRGEIAIPGDKSISHRALMLAAVAVGETRIDGLLEAEDVLATAEAMRRLGAVVERDGASWVIHGRGVGGLEEPTDILDFGNSGTGARLALGLLASHPILAFLCGDASLSRRPMGRVIEPLTRMGARFLARRGNLLPLAVEGSADPLPIEYRLPVASAQVKSAILLAALNAPGESIVIEPQRTRDHTERLLAHFGADLAIEDLAAGGRRIALKGQPELIGRPVMVPGDVSSAAFPLVAGLIVPGSSLRIPGIGINPLRAGLLTSLEEMGAAIRLENRRNEGGEDVADLSVEASSLCGTVIPEDRVPSMIDEFPILAVAAAVANGPSTWRGLGELRVKESDRLAAIAAGLTAVGVGVETGDDWMVIHGCGRAPAGGATVKTHMDHRIAMAFLVLGAVAEQPVRVDDAAAIATSFPQFRGTMNGLGARIGDDVG